MQHQLLFARKRRSGSLWVWGSFGRRLATALAIFVPGLLLIFVLRIADTILLPWQGGGEDAEIP